MKLFSKEIDKKLFKQYPKGEDLSSQVAVAKIFNPYGVGRWYLINSDPNDPDYIWAIVQMGNVVEVGSVSRKQLENLRIKPFNLPLERDLSFGGVNASELFKGLSAGKFYKAGGFTEGSENKDMLLNQAEGFEHHAEELESAVKKADYVPAWVVAKSQRASTDLSDITHYLDGENEQREEEMEGEEEYGNGGIIGGLTADESIYLYIKKAIVQKYREGYLKPAGLSGTPKGKYVEQSLIKKGFLNNAGAITEVGKNKAREVDSEIGMMISRGYISSTNLPSKYKEIVEKFESDDKMAVGGEVEGVDLFEDYENIPEKVQQILDNYADAFEDGDYKGLEKANNALLKIGYTFEYGLDGQAYDLRKVGEKGKSESYAKGGRLDVGRYYNTKDGKQVRYLGGTKDPEVGTFMNRADGVFKLRYDEVGGVASLFAEGGMMAKGGETLNVKYQENLEKLLTDEGWTLSFFDKYANDVPKEKAVELSLSRFEPQYEVKRIKLPTKKMVTFEWVMDKVSNDNIYKSFAANFKNLLNEKGLVGVNSYPTTYGIGVTQFMDSRISKEKIKNLLDSLGIEYINELSDAEYVYRFRISKSKSNIEKIKKLENKFEMGGKVKFADKVKSIKSSLLERKKVSPKVQKDYGKTYSPKEAEESAKRIVGAMTAKERLMAKKKKK